MPIQSYRDLEVWKCSMDLAKQIYPLTMSFRPPHRFEIGGQMRDAVVSIPSNIAEGYRQRLPKVYLRHLRIAAGSNGELETQLELAQCLGIAEAAEAASAAELSDRVGRMLNVLISRLSDRGR
jgi:four helix bundle protein